MRFPCPQPHKGSQKKAKIPSAPGKTSVLMFAGHWAQSVCVDLSILVLLPAGAQFYPTLRGAGRGCGGLVPDRDGLHGVASQQPVLQPPTPASVALQQVA